MTSTTARPNEARSQITWYSSGQMLPSGMLGPELDESTMASIKKYNMNLVPTTYEAANAYLQEELKKPEGTRELLREMCMMMPLNLPEDRKVFFKSDAVNLKILLRDGDALVYPTTDLPPNSFGNLENLGFLHHELDKLVFEPQAREPQQGMVLLAYFTKVGDSSGHGLKEYQLGINSPFV